MGIDTKKLKEEASYRRKEFSPENTPTKGGWYCKHCHKTFTHEIWFMRHNCREQEKYDEIRSSIGQAAYEYYSDWMRLQRRTVQSVDTFANSRFYNSFIRFAKFIQELNIIHPDAYVRIMVERGVSPMVWTNNMMYGIYLNKIDENKDPIELVNNSINYLRRVAEKANISSLGELLKLIQPNEIIDLVKRRTLTPWLLLNSALFVQHIFAKYDPTVKDTFAKILQTEVWYARIQQKSTECDTIRLLIKKAGL